MFAGAFSANLMVHNSILVLAFIALGNTLEALIGRWLLMRLKYFKLAFNSAKDYAALAAFGGLSVLSSALIGSATLVVSGTIHQSTMCELSPI